MRSSLTSSPIAPFLSRSFVNLKSLCSWTQFCNIPNSSESPLSQNHDTNTDFPEENTESIHDRPSLPTSDLTQTNVINTLLSYKNDPVLAIRYFNQVERERGFVKGLDSFYVLLHILAQHSEGRWFARNLLNQYVSGYSGTTATVLVDHLVECAKRFGFDLHSWVFTDLLNSYVRANKVNDALDCCHGMIEHDIIPGIELINVLFTALVKRNLMQEGEALYNKMVLRGVSGDRVTVNGLMSACLTERNPDGQYPQNLSDNVYQPNHNAGHYQWDQSLRPYQQNPIVEKYLPNSNDMLNLPNSNDIFNGPVASQAITNPTPEGQPPEASENSQNIGTLEKLDSFVREAKVTEAVEVLGLLEKQCVSIDLPRFLQLMKACVEAKALEEAKAVHEHLVRSLSPLKISTYNRVLKMYSECGSMDDAFDVFNNMGGHNLTSWDIMITGLAKNGLGEDAIDLFTQFKQAGLKPDGQMFIGVFSACSVLGDSIEGMLHFESMITDYRIVPSIKHYVSIVDMLGSTGYLDEALEFVEKMPMEPTVDVWERLMNLCRIHGNLELGDRCAEFVEQLDPSRLNEKSKAGLVPVEASDLAKDKEKKKLASQNLLEVRSKVHEYRAGDRSHPESDKIYAQIRGLKAQMKEFGYVPETRFVLHDIDQEGKEEALLAHSERLAVSHGLLNSPARAPIRIMKNLRVCGDCHTALKMISKIVGRELIIRDAKRFHHFKDGLCSCRDYW